MRILLAITNILVGFAKWSAIAAAMVMTVAIFLQVIFRYVLDDSLSSSEELARFMFIWSVAMGSAVALKGRAHIGVELLVERLPPGLAKPAKLLGSLVSLVFFAVLIWYGFDMTMETMDQESAALSLPMGYVYLSMPLSGIVMFLCEINNSIEDYCSADIHSGLAKRE